MSIKLVSSGSYNVRASEMAHDRQLKTVTCLVHFLDDTEEYFEIDVSSTFLRFINVIFYTIFLDVGTKFNRKFTFCLDMAQGRMNGAPSVIQTHL